MNQVVNFLSLLAVTEEQGGVKRMLGVCAEFERLARVVLEKGDKESPSRRKRRSSKITERDPHPPTTSIQTPQQHNSAPPPQSNDPQAPHNIFTPGFSGDLDNQAFDPNLQFTPSLSNIDLPLDFSGADFNTNMLGTSNGMEGFQMDGINNHQFSNDQLNVGSFQQPFVPQDLWQMPMTLEWDMADIGAAGGPGGFPSAALGGDQGQNQ